jgi:phage minor structural protein
MDNTSPKALHYYNDELHEYLQGSAYTYTFTANARHEDAEYLIEGNKLAFERGDKDYYLNIMSVERTEYEVTVEAYGLSLELLNEYTNAYSAPKAMTAEEYIKAFNFANILTIGVNEVSDKRITHEWTGTDTILARLFSLATVFSAEAEFVAELNDDYSLKRIVLNLYREYDAETGAQGIGSDRQDITLRYGVNVSGVRKISDIREMYTAIRPFGKDDLTVTSLDKKEYDADGNLQYMSPAGDNNIYAVQACEQFPSNLMKSTTDRYICEIWSYDTDNANTLYGQALAQLKKHCIPQIDYEVLGYFDTDIGDTVSITDEAYTPTLYLTARVSEQVRSFTDPTRNKTTFSNFTELQPQISEDLLARMEKLIAENKVYTCMISTDNGIVFKNSEGSTTLTANVRDSGVDVTKDFTIRWKKDGAGLAEGRSIVVNASDVYQKAVYRFEAYDSKGKMRGSYEATVTDVLDGKPTYIHFAYANSADGTKDFSKTDSMREYVGIYADWEVSGSSDPSAYQWSAIKGADGKNGTDGTPGKAGEDGRTPYVHFAYANSSDGKTDFSTSDASNRQYMGNYADFVQADSTDPKDYTWVKVKGEDGRDGTPGPAGTDGKTSYFHVKYSTVANPTTSSQMSETPNVYIGTYVDYTEADSADPKKYTWAKFQGIDGKDGTDGIPGTNGADGKTSYLHIKYSDDGGKTFTANSGETPGDYIGQYVDFTKADSGSVSAYTWKKIKGADGADAVLLAITSSAGTIFKNGAVNTTLTAHLFRGGNELTGTEIAKLGTVKWYKDGSATAASTGITMSASSGGAYRAQLEAGGGVLAVDQIALTDIRDISSITRFYLLRDETEAVPSKPTANPPGAGWQTTEPEYQEGSHKNLYTTERVVYSTGAFSYSDVSLSSSYTAAKKAYEKAESAQSSAKEAVETAKKAGMWVSELEPDDKSRVWCDTGEKPPVIKQHNGTEWVVVNDRTAAENLIYTNLLDEIEKAGGNVMLQVGEKIYDKEDVDNLIASVSTTYQQLADRFELNFSSLTQQINDLDADVEERFIETNKYIRFIDGAIIIGIEDNPLILKMQNDRISFLENGNEVAYISNRRMYITDVEILSSLTVGNFAFVPRNNGNLSFKKIR